MWALQKLRKLMVSRLGKLLNIPSLLKMEQGLNTDSALPTLVKGLPQALLRQYEYEDSAVRSGKHLMHSSFFKVSIFIYSRYLHCFQKFHSCCVCICWCRNMFTGPLVGNGHFWLHYFNPQVTSHRIICLLHWKHSFVF